MVAGYRHVVYGLAEGPTRLLRADRYISVQSSDEPVMGDSFKLGAGCCAAVTKELHFGL